jgi:hypothetical protein
MLTKIVNGKQEICSAEEEAAIRAEWAANDPALKPPAKEVTLSDLQARVEKLEAATKANAK